MFSVFRWETTRLPSTLSWFGFIGLFIVALGLRWARVDADFERRVLETDVRDLIRSPGTHQMRALSLQHQLALADLFWLSAVQEIGRFIEKKEPSVVRLKNWAQLATDLDPRYHQVYYGVSVNLTVYNKDADGSDRLLRKAEKNLPGRWQFPFLLGYNAYFLRGDLRTASEHWRKGAELAKSDPSAPRFLPSLAARSRFQAGDEEEAVRLLEAMIPELEGEHKEDAMIRLGIIKSEPILRAYDRACLEYEAQHGVRPVSADELRIAGLVAYPPQDLFGKPIELDERCRARTEVIRVREDEAVKRAGSEAEGRRPPNIP